MAAATYPMPLTRRHAIVREDTAFTCRVCGAHQFQPRFAQAGGLRREHEQPSHYACSGCSVLFEDPEKFSKKPFHMKFLG